VRLSVGLAVATLTAGLALAAGSDPFAVAYVHPADTGTALTVFPIVGKELTVPAPPGLSNIGRAVSSSDGKTIYVFRSGGVWRNDLIPHRQSIVRGTSGFIAVWHFTMSGDRIFVSGSLNMEARIECGTYLITPDSESPLRLLAGAFPECGGGGGEVSPDGRRVLSHSGGDVALVDLKSGKPQIVSGLRDLKRDDVTWKGQAAWSPDGKWIAAFRDGSVTLVDANTLRLRKIGRASGIIGWSPDSRKLLVSKSQLSCLAYLYFESLAVIDLETGKENIIKSSHCNIVGGWVGWIDPEAVR
jgi:hypothetical protein